MSEDAHQDVKTNQTSSISTVHPNTSILLACAPVTALCFLNPLPFLLAGQGSHLKLFKVGLREDSPSCVHELKVWNFQRIHGIVRHRWNDEAVSEQLLVFGGKKVAIVEHDRSK